MTNLTTLSQNPATHTYTTRVDCRHLAALALYWNSKGERPRSSSELIRLSLEALASALYQGGEVSFISDLDVAIETLSRFGLSGKPIGRNLQDVRLNIARLAEGVQPEGLARLHNQKAAGTISPVEHAAALAEFESRLLDHADRDEVQVQQFKDSFKTPPTSEDSTND